MNIAIVGATGAVGREMLTVLAQRKFPADEIRLLASERSEGEKLEYSGIGELEELTVEELTAESFEGIDIALFSAGGEISKEYGPIAVEKGVIVVDNSSAFRMDKDVALIVPEVNATWLKQVISKPRENQGLIIANPNCSTIQLVVALNPIHQEFGIKRAVVSTYQSVSGAGQKGIEELWQQTLAICNQKEVEIKAFARQIAFNCIPHCDSFLENGYTKEEMKVVHETRKILDAPSMRITVTAVRVPVFACHSESVALELEKACSATQAKELLAKSPGIIVCDNPEELEYPVATQVAGTDATYVGRIRVDESVENGLQLWVVADNLRKGAALNAVQIAEIVLRESNKH